MLPLRCIRPQTNQNIRHKLDLCEVLTGFYGYVIGVVGLRARFSKKRGLAVGRGNEVSPKQNRTNVVAVFALEITGPKLG